MLSPQFYVVFPKVVVFLSLTIVLFNLCKKEKEKDDILVVQHFLLLTKVHTRNNNKDTLQASKEFDNDEQKRLLGHYKVIFSICVLNPKVIVVTKILSMCTNNTNVLLYTRCLIIYWNWLRTPYFNHNSK